MATHDSITRSEESRRRASMEPMAVMEDLEPRLLLATFTVTTLLDVVDGGDGLTSLREAAALANANPGADIINVGIAPFEDPDNAGQYLDGTMFLAGTEIAFTESVTINGAVDPNDDVPLLTINAFNASRIFDIVADEASINRMTLTGGATANNGGAVQFVGSMLTIGESTISNSFATNGDTGSGGALSVTGATVNMSAVTISGNTADVGGGIYAANCTVNLAYVTFDDNAATVDGGGIYMNGGTLTTENGAISGGAAGGDGAGLYLRSATTNLGSPVANNIADGNGGGIYMKSGTLSINAVNVGQNEATNGGGLYQEGGMTTMADGFMTQNAVTDGSGGGIYVTTGSVVAAFGIFSGNTATEIDPDAITSGGAFYAHYASLNLDRTTIKDNSVDGDGGGVALDHSDAYFLQVTVSSNEAVGDGGGVFIGTGSNLDTDNSTIAQNTAENGGGVFNDSASITITSTILGDNTANEAPDVFGTIDASSSLIGDSEGATIFGGGNVVDVDPMLEDIGASVGHDLLPGSPAINSGANPTGATLDARGWPRLFGPIDMGAIEHQPNIGPEIDVEVFGEDNITAVDFGLVPSNGSTTIVFTVRNEGTAALTVSGFEGLGIFSTFAGSPDNAPDDDTQNWLILPGRTFEFFVTFTPTADQVFLDQIMLTNTDANESDYRIDLSGTGIGGLVGNFNGDANDDILIFGTDRLLWVNATQGLSTIWGQLPANQVWRQLMVGDVNADGNDDLIGRTALGQWYAMVSDGAGTFTNTYFGAWANLDWSDINVGDFNGDGQADVVGRLTDYGSWWTGLSTGTSFTNAYFGVWAPGMDWDDVIVGDLTGDGTDDIIGRIDSNGAWWAGISNGTSFVNAYWGSWSPAVTWVDVSCGDFNNDGRCDVVGRASAQGTWFAGLSTGSALSTLYIGIWNPGVAWNDVMLLDFNGDGRMDVAGRTNLGAWYVGISTGTIIINTYVGSWSFGVTWSGVSIGDVNGDGKDDIFGHVDTTNVWWVGVSNGAVINSIMYT